MADFVRVLYLANVGNRDVRLDGAIIPAEESRVLGEAMLADYDAYAARLSAPILEAGIRLVLSQASRERPLKITPYLFGTNQPENAGAHRAKDTHALAKVAGCYLQQAFPQGAEPKGIYGHVAKLAGREIRANPALYDEMYDWFGQELAVAPEVDAVYVSCTGGTPAANFALLVRAIERFGARCHTLYVPEGRGSPVRLGIEDKLQRAVLRTRARDVIEGHEFARAASLLAELDVNPALRLLAEHAAHRLHFDFASARKVLTAPEFKSGGPAREEAARLSDELDRLITGPNRARALIGELYSNARVAWAQGRYVDFLMRAYRLHEALLRLVVEESLGLPTDDNDGKALPAYTEGILANPDLKRWLDGRVPGNDYDATRTPSRQILLLLVDYAIKRQPAASQCFGALGPVLKRMERMTSLRNKCIGGHGFEGVSRERLEEAYQGNLEEDLKTAIRTLEIDPADDPFERVRKLLLAGLAERR